MSSVSKPRPLADPDTEPFWRAARQSQLQAPQCADCGCLFLPPRPRCPQCQSANFLWTTLTGRGHIYTFCITRMPLVRGFEPPYVVAVVELEDLPGSRLNANILDCPIDQVKIGMPVEVVFEMRGEDVAIPQFRPLQTAQD